jgi:hypothetical protein
VLKKNLLNLDKIDPHLPYDSFAFAKRFAGKVNAGHLTYQGVNIIIGICLSELSNESPEFYNKIHNNKRVLNSMLEAACGSKLYDEIQKERKETKNQRYLRKKAK